MAQAHTQRYCPTCERMTLAVAQTPTHLLHLVLSILTAGMWLVVWILLALMPKNWRCSQCGNSDLLYRKPGKAWNTGDPSRAAGVFAAIALVGFLGGLLELHNGNDKGLLAGMILFCFSAALAVGLYLKGTK